MGEAVFGERAHELLGAAAAVFDDGGSPFEAWWLVEHAVTADECMALGEQLALLVQGYLNAPHEVQVAIVVAGAAGGVASGDPGGQARIAEAAFIRGAQDLAARRIREVAGRGR